MSVELCMIGKNTPNSYIHIDGFAFHYFGTPFKALDGVSIRGALEFLWKHL